MPSPFSSLVFIHQDASGASVQQTKEDGALAQPYPGYRTAEMDALGNDVGDFNPYLTHTEPPAENLNSSIKLGDSPYGGGGSSSGPMSPPI